MNAWTMEGLTILFSLLAFSWKLGGFKEWARRLRRIWRLHRAWLEEAE